MVVAYWKYRLFLKQAVALGRSHHHPMWVLSVYPMGAHTLEDNIAMNAPARCKAIIVLSPCNNPLGERTVLFGALAKRQRQ